MLHNLEISSWIRRAQGSELYPNVASTKIKLAEPKQGNFRNQQVCGLKQFYNQASQESRSVE